MALDIDASLASAIVPIDGPAARSRIVPFVVSFDPAPFDAWIDGILDELGGDATDAAVRLDGTRVTVVPAVQGVSIDRSLLEASFHQQLATLQPVALQADVRQGDPLITTETAEAAAVRAEHVLSRSWTFTAADREWEITPEEIAPALRFVPQADGSLGLSWDTELVSELIGGFASHVSVEASDAWIQDLGTKQWLVPATVSQELDIPGTMTAMHQALADGEHVVALVVRSGETPAVTTRQAMADLGMTGVVGEGSSIYAGSGSGRTHNVELAAHMIDGTLVAPGEVFSFNAAVGSLFTGAYMDAGSYIDGPGGQSLAGGVCQVSTTVFRAALDAGFPIVEWWPHSYRSPFYELGGWSPGWDAAIVQDSRNPAESTDFRFRNTTDAWLLISAKVANGELTVRIFGADPGYSVYFDAPVIEFTEQATGAVSVVVDEHLAPGTIDESPAMDGLRVTVVRYVYDEAGALVSQDAFVSPYGAYGAIRRLSPDMAE